MQTPKLQRWIFRLTVGALFAVSIWGALPSIYYAPYGPVGDDVVSVYEPDDDSRVPLVSIRKIDPEKIPDPFVDTGKKVYVYLRRTYRDERAQFVSTLFLSILVTGLVANWWVSRKKEPIQPPQRNAGSGPSSKDSLASKTPSSLGPRG